MITRIYQSKFASPERTFEDDCDEIMSGYFDKFYKYKHTPVEIPIGFLKVLHEDITHAMQKAWREKVEEDYGKK